MRRFPLHKVPNIVPLSGILLSLLFSALSWGIGATNAIESVIFGLIGTVLSVQFEILVRQEQHHEFAELLGSDRWLRESIKSIVTDGATIATEFRDTAIEDEARRLLQHFCVDFGALRLGRLRRGQEDLQYLIQHTRDAKTEILAVTNVGQGTGSLRWWREGQGLTYLRENIAATQRGISINRILIYSKDQEQDAHDLASEHHTAGVHVKLVLRETLLPEQRINFAVWDARVSCELQMNADGNPIAFIYCVGAADIRRLIEIHRTLWISSTDYIS